MMLVQMMKFPVLLAVFLLVLYQAQVTSFHFKSTSSIRRFSSRCSATLEKLPVAAVGSSSSSAGSIRSTPQIYPQSIISRITNTGNTTSISNAAEVPLMLQGSHSKSNKGLKTHPAPTSFLENLSIMLEQESVSTFLPKDDLIAMANEIRFNQVIMKKAYERFEVIWKYFRTMVYDENRTLRDILGEDIYAKVLEVAGKLDFYDKQTVRSFIGTPAFVAMFGGIVYETLSEAVGRAGWIGRRVEKVPLIGPLRQRVRRSIKSRVDRTVGSRFKKRVFGMVDEDSLLSLADFMAAQQNNKPFEDVNRRIIFGICNRPINSFFPDRSEGDGDEKLKQAIWSIVTDTPTAEFLPIMNYLYDNLGSARLSDIVALNFDPQLASQSGSIAADGAKTIFSHNVQGATVNIIIKI